ncbi:MAG: hypothetical protein HFI01_03710 [Lachnospiraceae bacterium]|jgi:hypothetical protein|nr:hypothetical protein [Lachnospiraceae bacterium]MCI9108446.1 hypothetical protein [Lachnospiraceae bacterium]MCI9342080.1 hypothetical protein [Lachnospiraceae bacterium]GFH89837.1 hypothetical protein IMSAGC002_01082 [Lachnospiraceae bacterium]
MSVNGVTGSSGAADLYGTYKTNSAKPAEKTENKKEENNSGVVYEPSSSATTGSVSKKPDANLVAKLKADSDARISQMKSLVEQMISKQGQTLGKTDSIWSFLASGNFTVDAATKAQAQKDIADDGYWGVEQTSSRIVDFATALAGSDPKQLEKMRDAFKKGFDNATSTWGKSLPDISQRTYQAVMDKFDKLVAAEE